MRSSRPVGHKSAQTSAQPHARKKKYATATTRRALPLAAAATAATAAAAALMLLLSSYAPTQSAEAHVATDDVASYRSRRLGDAYRARALSGATSASFVDAGPPAADVEVDWQAMLMSLLSRKVQSSDLDDLGPKLFRAAMARPDDAVVKLALGLAYVMRAADGVSGKVVPMNKAVGALWEALSIAKRARGEEASASYQLMAAEMIFASLLAPPNCARTMREQLAHSVTACTPAERMQNPTGGGEWPPQASPWLAKVDGPWGITAVSGVGHAIRPMASPCDKTVCWLYPASHAAMRLFDADIGAAAARAESSARPASGAVGSLLHTFDGANFYHLLTEGLASLVLLATSKKVTKLLVPESEQWRQWIDYMREFAPHVPLGDVEFVGSERSWAGEDDSALYFVDWRRPGKHNDGPADTWGRVEMWRDMTHVEEFGGAAVQLVRAALAGAAGGAPGIESCSELTAGGRPRVVYITRDDAKSRRVSGEHALVEMLEAADSGGWDVLRVDLTQLSVRETADTIRGAAVVVGAHGAGLFNAPLFSRTAECTGGRGSSTLIAFGLLTEHKSKEGNLVSACARVGLRLEILSDVTASYFGDYRLGVAEMGSVVTAVRAAVRRWERGGRSDA